MTGGPTIIEQALDRIDIVSVLAAHGVEVRSDRDTSIRCPLSGHDDSTPSFSVRPGRGRWRCFGCQRGGDALDLAAELEGRSPADVARDIVGSVPFKAQRRKTKPRPKTPPRPPRRIPSSELMRLWARCHLPLTAYDLAEPVDAYLMRRGLDAEAVRRHGLARCTPAAHEHRLAKPETFSLEVKGWRPPDTPARVEVKDFVTGEAFEWPTWWPGDRDEAKAEELASYIESKTGEAPPAIKLRWDLHRLVVRAFDARGRFCGIQGRTVEDLDGLPRYRWARDRKRETETHSLLFLDGNGRELCLGTPPKGLNKIVIAEGLTDWLSAASRLAAPPVAVIGAASGGFEALGDVGIPEHVAIVAIVDEDKAGDRYLNTIAEAVKRPVARVSMEDIVNG